MPPNQDKTDAYYRDLDDAVLNDETVRFATDQIVDVEPLRRTSTLRRESFVEEFIQSKGPPQVIFLVLLLALGFGSTIGVVPAVMTDRYARLNHGYDAPEDCADYGMNDKPDACLLGSADAQNAVALEQLISNSLQFFTSSLMGSLSDEYGRRGMMIIGLTLSALSPLCLLLIQIIPGMSPSWYYAAGAAGGFVSWITVALSSLSDAMPAQWRAPSFGLLLAGFSLGFAMAPFLALALGHFNVSAMAFTLVAIGLITTVLFLPETLPPEKAAEAREERKKQFGGLTGMRKTLWTIYRPVWELSILNRNRLFRLLSLLAFFSGAVSAGDRTLLLYYLEERLAFNDQDVAVFFFIVGSLGIFVQGIVLKLLNEAVGERKVVMVSFALGAVHNVMYGLAKNKATIFVAASIAAFGSMAFPTISAIKANNVMESEQGRIQGALYSIKALSYAIGPLILRFIYHYTSDGALLGPGTMFVVGACLFLVAVYCAYELPVEANSSHKKDDSYAEPGETLEGPSRDSDPLL